MVAILNERKIFLAVGAAIPVREVWVGNPARKLRDVPEDELLPE